MSVNIRLVQILGDGVEELWNFDSSYSDEEIVFWYQDWTDRPEFDTFDDYMEEVNPGVFCQRVFVDEIYV